MLSHPAVSLVVSCALGFLSGLGVGGGSLLMLWLTLIMEIPQDQARGMNLLFFLPSAVIASVFRHREGRLRIRQLLPGILLGCLSAAAFSLISPRLPLGILKKLFGILLLYTGLREVFYRPKKEKN